MSLTLEEKQIDAQNMLLLQQIIKMYAYLKRYPELKQDGTNYRFDVRHIDRSVELEVSPDATTGILHTWCVSRHNGDYYDLQKKELALSELNKALAAVYASLRRDTETSVQTEAIKELTEKKLKRMGFLRI